MKKLLHDRGIIARYREFLPISSDTPVVSLSEGSTPLLFSPWLSEAAACEVYLKYEGLNPTASFKDRGMTVAISKAVERGARSVICASTGNTSAAAAAYAARAGLACVVLLPVGKIARGKLMQAFAYGAHVIAIRGNFDLALKLVREFGESRSFEIVNSINPFRIEGQKTASFEIIDELGDAPDFHLLPVGNAGNITAYWKGYKEFHQRGRSTRLPRMFGFQAEGAAPVFHNKAVEHPETVASAIRIGNPASWDGARQALHESNGRVGILTDAEILEAQQALSSREGIFVEPASAASVAGLLKALWLGVPEPLDLRATSRIVCTVTGHGLKDPDTPILEKCRAIESEGTTEAVRAVLASQNIPLFPG